MKELLEEKEHEILMNKQESEMERENILSTLKVSDVRQQMSTYKTQLNTQQNELGACMKELSKVEETMKAEILKWRTQATEQKQIVALREKRINDLENELKETRGEISRLREGSGGANLPEPASRENYYENRIEDLQNELKVKQKTIETLENALAERHADLKYDDEDAVQTEQQRRLPSARKMSTAISGPDEGHVIYDELMKYGKQGARRAKSKHVWFVYTKNNHSAHIEWADQQSALNGKKAIVEDVSEDRKYIKGKFSKEELRKCFSVICTDGNIYVFSCKDEKMKQKWVRGIAKCVRRAEN